MPRLFVDEREVILPQPGMSLDQILRHVEEMEVAPRCVIQQVHIDGSPLNAECLRETPASLPTDISERERIEIRTTPVDDVVRNSVREALSYLERSEAAIPSLAAGFQGFPGPEAFESLRQLYEGFYWLNILMDKLERTFRVVPAQVQVRGTPLKEHHESLVNILRQLVESQERGDYILISDLLEYEVLPYIAVWKEIFNMFVASLPVPA